MTAVSSFIVNTAHTYCMDEGFINKSNAKLGLLSITVTMQA